MLPGLFSKQRMLQLSAVAVQLPGRWALRALRIETRCLPSCTQLLQSPHNPTPPLCPLRGLGMRKLRILAPVSWGAYQRDDFSEPRPLHLPIHRKALNSLTWDIWFSLINNNLLMFRLPGLCCKNFCISWLPPYLFGAGPQSDISERLCPRLKSSVLSAE